jgi:hypothetical protein
MRPVPHIKTFHYLGFINCRENDCQDKSARLTFKTNHAEKAGKGVPSQTIAITYQKQECNNDSVLGLLRGDRGSGFNEMVVLTRV